MADSRYISNRLYDFDEILHNDTDLAYSTRAVETKTAIS